MQTKEYIIEFLKKHKNRLKEKYQVQNIALFGSFANNSATQTSDIDILVDMPSSFDNFFELKYFLEDNFQTKVDLVKENNLRLLVKNQIKSELIYV
jgi:predicted nucleotidyltransferase